MIDVEQNEKRIQALQKEIDDAGNLDYPMGTQIRFTWLSGPAPKYVPQNILAEVIDIVRGGAIRVILLENAVRGTQKIGMRMVIPLKWITEIVT